MPQKSTVALEAWPRIKNSLINAFEEQIQLDLKHDQEACEICSEIIKKIRSTAPTWFQERDHQKSFAAIVRDLVPQICSFADQLLEKESAEEQECINWLQSKFKPFFELLTKGSLKSISESKSNYDLGSNTSMFADPLQVDIDLLAPFGETRRETKHTKYFAWFLTECSRENPLIIDNFIRLLQERASKEYPMEGDRLHWPTRTSAVDITAEDENFVSVMGRDFPTIDLTLRFPKDNISIIVEAKIDADEGDDQLHAYEQVAEKCDDRYGRPIFVFLTLDRKHPTGQHDAIWIPISWTDIAALFISSIPIEIKEGDSAFLRLWIATLLRKVCKCPAIDKAAEARDVIGLSRLTHYLETYSLLKKH